MYLTRKIVSVLPLLALACLGGAQQPTPSVSYARPAAPVAAILADLSKQSGMVLMATPSVASDVVMLNVKDVPVAEIMKRLAVALHAEWTLGSGDRYTLSRSQAPENNDRRTELAEKVAAAQQYIAKLAATVRSQPKFDDAAARKIARESKDQMDQMLERATSGGAVRMTASGMADAGVKTPAGRAIVALLSQLSANQLASIVSGNRVVFSTSPTRMQFGLSGAATQTLQQFVNEQRLYSDAQKQLQSADSGRQFMVFGAGDSTSGDGDPRLGMGPSLLIADPAPFGRSVSIHLLVTDRNGATLARGTMMVPYEFPRAEAKPTHFDGEKPIQLSELSTEFAKAIRSASGSAGGAMTRMVFRTNNSTVSLSGDPLAKPPVAISKELRERILNPEKFEPLSLAPSEGFSAVAAAWGKNFLAYLPDGSMVPLTNQLSAKATTPSELLAMAQTSVDLDVATEAGWMTITPRHPAAARLRRVERQGLGKYLRTIDAQGYSGLDDMAAFALAQTKQPTFGDFDHAYIRLINAGVADQDLSKVGFPGGWGMLRFFGTLSPAQRRSLGDGTTLPIANLTPQQMDLLTDQVFNSIDGPVLQSPDAPPSERAIVFGAPTLAQERTIVLPNGVMRNGFLTVRANSEAAVQAMDSHTGSSGMMTAGSLAWAKLIAEKPGMFGGLGATTPTPDQYRMASQTSYSFVFTLAPNVTLLRSLEDASVDRNANLVKYEALPADFRQRVDAVLADLRNMNFGGVRGPGAGTRPPAP